MVWQADDMALVAQEVGEFLLKSWEKHDFDGARRRSQEIHEGEQRREGSSPI